EAEDREAPELRRDHRRPALGAGVRLGERRRGATLADQGRHRRAALAAVVEVGAQLGGRARGQALLDEVAQLLRVGTAARHGGPVSAPTLMPARASAFLSSDLLTARM